MKPCFLISDFLHFVPVSPGIVAAYNSLTCGVIFIPLEIAEKLKRAIGGIFQIDELGNSEDSAAIINAMLDRRMVFPVGTRLDTEDYLRTQKLLESHGPTILYLMLADGCNLACGYCYIEKPTDRNRQAKLMQPDVAETAINKFADSVSKEIEEPQIVLYGGEPLLNKPVLFHVLDIIEEMKKTDRLAQGVGIALNTNGVLIDEDFADRVRDRGLQISISLDGKEGAHNSVRVFKNGTGTFSSITKACEILRKKGVGFGFSVTINKYNIHELEDILIWLNTSFGCRSFGFNILVDREENLMGMTEAQYAEKVTEKLIRCFEICRERGIYEDRMMRKVNAFIRGYPYPSDCGATGGQMVVTPDRQIGVCQAYCASGRNFFPIDSIGDVRQHPLWKTWQFRSPLYQKQCRGCVALSICGGGCPYSAEIKHGSIWATDDVFCVHARGTMVYLLKELYRQTAESQPG